MGNISKNWKLISRKEVYDGSPFVKVSIDTVKLPNGETIDDYHRIEVHNAVMLLVENEKKELLVYEEYRHGVAEVSYTFPAGGIENDETLESASKRELLEETGYDCKDIKLLKNYIVSGSYMFGELNIMRIRKIKKIAEPKSKDIEDPDHIWLSKSQVKNSVINNDFKALTYATAALIWLLYEEKE
tara:strand:- start:1671 stop:2228 length:558 start_codon:yes stop_codon:yes gene_type:complete